MFLQIKSFLKQPDSEVANILISVVVQEKHYTNHVCSLERPQIFVQQTMHRHANTKKICLTCMRQQDHKPRSLTTQRSKIILLKDITLFYLYWFSTSTIGHLSMSETNLTLKLDQPQIEACSNDDSSTQCSILAVCTG